MEDLDVLYVEWLESYLFTATHLPKTCRIVVRGHFSDLTMAWAKQTDWSKVDLLIFTNDFNQKTFDDWTGNPRVEKRIIRLGVNLDKFHLKPLKYDRKIGFCGYIKPRKEPVPVINLMRSLPEWTLIFKATPSTYKNLTVEVKKLIERSLNIVWIPEWLEDIAPFYQDLDIFINNSTSEGQGVSILEAMSCGVYSLIRNWPHAIELYPQENVFSDLQECRGKIISWSEKSNDEKRKISVETRAFIAKYYDGARYVKEMRQAIEQV